MRSPNKRSRAAKIKPLLTPPLGTREYLDQGGYVFFILGSLLFTAAHLYMLSVETKFGNNLICSLGYLGVILLCAGALEAFIAAKMRFIPPVFSAFGLCAVGASAVLFFIIDLTEVFSLSDPLSIIQVVFSLAFLACTVLTLLWLILSLLGLRVMPSLGYLPAITGVIAVLLLLVRTMTSFASLKNALGDDYKWEAALTEMPEQLSWVLRSVSPESALAQPMFYARLLERMGALLLIASALPILFAFPFHFREFNKRMEHSADIHRINREAHPEQYEVEDEDDDELDAGEPLIGLRSAISSKLSGLSDHLGSRSQRADENAGSRDAQEPVKRSSAPPSNFRSRGRSASPESPASSASPVSGYSAPKPPVVRNSETGAAVVTVRKTTAPPKKKLPDPDDMSIWNNYRD